MNKAELTKFYNHHRSASVRCNELAQSMVSSTRGGLLEAEKMVDIGKWHASKASEYARSYIG